jgi:small GTP-binding protein
MFSPPAQKKKELIEIAMIGPPGVGKTALLVAYVNEKFTPSYRRTIGCDFLTKSLILNGNNATLRIWDTTTLDDQDFGRKLFDEHVASVLHVSVLCFDLTSVDSLDKLSALIPKIANSINMDKIILVGTKSDLVNDIKVTQKMIDRFMKYHQLTEHMITSAKDFANGNVNTLMQASAVLARKKAREFIAETTVQTHADEAMEEYHLRLVLRSGK